MTSSTAATTPAQQAAVAVLETVPLVMRTIRGRMREGRPTDMSVGQFRALLYLRRHPGTDLSAMADHLGTSLPSASDLVARLVRQDLVAREIDPACRRRICLTLSSAGLAHLEAAEQRTTESFVHTFQRLGPARLAALLESLDDLRALAAHDDGSSSAASEEDASS